MINNPDWITEIGWNSGKGGNLSCLEIMAVDPVQQAIYIKESFDILYNEVTLWEQSTPAINKIFVYQFRDIGLDDTLLCGIVGEKTLSQTMLVNQASLGLIPSSQTTIPQETIDWHFGLYKSDKITPKPAQCVFAAYPEQGDCFETIYIPAILKNH